ncbi:hypothetical protein SAMN05661044_01835 [Olivibacter domesticus]|uniref:Uncharacterized protein n=1 Tax=Olivibacter domesticus TaxID=407022 RepID=A0A1H7M292_OLID1|nr:hypothetical protein SAMN05661044_01835 [Olivibacter domesticus]
MGDENLLDSRLYSQVACLLMYTNLGLNILNDGVKKRQIKGPYATK